jgi:outer membrane lipoprotein LolB
VRPGRALRLRGALAAAALAAAACAGPRFTLPAAEAEFEVSGRFAVKYGEDAASGNFAWRHAPASDEMLLTTPFGQGIARIVRVGGAYSLTTPEPREYHAADAESLTEQVLGFRLPLAGLADWARGRPAQAPAPPPGAIQRDDSGLLKRFTQSGWSVEYVEYDEAARPRRMRLDYPGLELRLAISEWR